MISDLWSVDGKPDLAKAAACVAHFLMACAFGRLQLFGQDFQLELWLTYGGFAIAHDGYNRATALLHDHSRRKIEAQNGPALDSGATASVTTTTVVKP